MKGRHPLLLDPERYKAYQLMRSEPTSTERAWAEKLGWTQPRLHRFILALERQNLIVVTRTKYGTRIKTVSRPYHRRITGVSQPNHLDEKEREILDQGDTATYESQLIEAMNDELVRLLPGFRPVRSDNKSSIDAGSRIRQAGVPLERAIEVLQQDCRKFNISKHGRGEYPYSLAYFEKGVLDRWRAEQTVLPLLTVQRASKKGVRRSEGKPAAAGDVIASVMNDLKRKVE